MNNNDNQNIPNDPTNYKSIMYQRYISTRGNNAKYTLPSKKQEKSFYDYFEIKLSKWLPDDRCSSILDLGCGQGNFLKYLDSQGYSNITGVDISPEQISLAMAAVLDAQIYEMDMIDFLNGKSSSYDCITALDVIEHLEKEQVLHFLDAVYNALKPGGRLILQTPNAASPWATSLIFGDFSHGCSFTPSSLKQLLTLTGFKDIRSQEAGPIPRSLKSAIRYILWKAFSLYFKFYNLIEMGTIGDGIFTRVFQCSAKKNSD